MDIREVNAGEVLVLVPNGSVTTSEESSAMALKLEATLKAGVKFVVVDCGAVKQVTSASVRVLLAASRRLDRTGGRLVLCDLTTQLRKALSISGVDKDFSVAATRDEGVQRAREAVGSASQAVAAASAPHGDVVGATPPPSAIDVPQPIAPDADPVAASTPSASAPSTIDRRNELAVVLLDALGRLAVSAAPVAASQRTGPELDAIATRVLAALHARTAGPAAAGALGSDRPNGTA